MPPSASVCGLASVSQLPAIVDIMYEVTCGGAASTCAPEPLPLPLPLPLPAWASTAELLPGSPPPHAAMIEIAKRIWVISNDGVGARTARWSDQTYSVLQLQR